MASFANMHVWLLSVWPFELSAQRIKDVHNSWAFIASFFLNNLREHRFVI